jgi:glycosyltransferase involved in cell wall biosynthesis
MYNEKDNIETAVTEAIRVGALITPDLEIIVVDDASTDGSGALLDHLASDHPQVHPIHHPHNRKLGGALKTGFASTTKEWLLYIDSDLPICMDDALSAMPLTDKADVVIGWRKSRAESWRRKLMSLVYNRLIRFMFGLRVQDVNFAFKLFRRSLYQRVLLESEGSFIDAELLIEAQRQGARIAEIGMEYHPRVAGKSTLGSYIVVLKILLEMFRYQARIFAKSYEKFSNKHRQSWVPFPGSVVDYHQKPRSL